MNKTKNKLLGLLGMALMAAITASPVANAEPGGWINGDDGYRFKFDRVTLDSEQCGGEFDSVNFFLHGAGGDALSYHPASMLENGDVDGLFDSIYDSCGLIVVPQAPPARYATWDYTGYYTADGEIARVTRLIMLAKSLFPDASMTLTGGADGGTMAFAVASRLNRIGRHDLIDKLVLVKAQSPYMVRVNELLPAFDGVGPLTCSQPSDTQSLDGSVEEDEACAFIMLGLPNKEASFYTDTLLVYEDSPISAHFANTVVHYSSIGPNTANVISNGVNWNDVSDFILP